MSYLTNLKAALLGRETTNAKGVSRRASGWNAATNTRRFMKWAARREAINTLIYADGERLRDRARDSARQNPWAASAIESMTANVVGTGIKPQSLHPQKSVRDLLHKLWKYFVLNCDSEGRTDFYGLEALAFRAMVESGEVLVRTRYRRKSDAMIIPMKLQLLEGDYLPLYNNGALDGGNVVQTSIEFNPLGQRVAYHLYLRHPYEYLPNNQPLETVRIGADTVDHIYKMLRPGQIRGVTWLGPALAKLYDINEYDDSELLRKKFSAMFVGFITETDPDDPVINTTSDSNENTPTSEEDATGTDQEQVDFAELQAGTMVRLGTNEGVEFSKPEDVGGMYPDFMRQQLLAVAAALGCTIEMMTGDVARVNYSSIRAQVLEFRRKAEQWQKGILCYQMLQPTWERFIRACAIAGLIDANDFAKAPLDYLICQWNADSWAWVDPEKDIKAELLEIRGGLKARSTSIGERGGVAEEVDSAIASDNERADAAKLVYDSDPRLRDSTGKAVLVSPGRPVPTKQSAADTPADDGTPTDPAPTSKGKQVVQ